MAVRKNNRPCYQYEDTVPLHGYTEQGVDSSARIGNMTEGGIGCPDLQKLIKATSELNLSSTLKWIEDNSSAFSKSSVIVEGDNVDYGDASSKNSIDFIVLAKSLNQVKDLNALLYASSDSLSEGGYLWAHCKTAGIRKAAIYAAYPPVIRNVFYTAHYIWHRTFPKLRVTRWFYFLVTGGANRYYHRVEVLGRIYRAGFEVLDEGFRYGHFYVTARKIKAPVDDSAPTGSPIIRLRRVGKEGKIVGIYKFRTMHTYSEYLQPYIYKYNSLAEGGKFANDYRIAGYGIFLRKYWLDELPMFWNYLRRDVKLVGVRPISRQYYSLYSSDMQQLRIKTKPGILPPFYYDRQRPKDIDEVQQSEKRYIESYLKKPFRTDWRYFWGTLGNILFRGARSK